MNKDLIAAVQRQQLDKDDIAYLAAQFVSQPRDFASACSLVIYLTALHSRRVA